MVPWKSEDKLIDLHIYIEFLRIYVYFMNYCHFYHTHTKNVSIQTLEKKTPWSKNDWWLGSQATEGLQHGMLTPGMPGTGGVGVGLSIIKRNLWKKNSKMSRNLRIQIWWLDYVLSKNTLIIWGKIGKPTNFVMVYVELTCSIPTFWLEHYVSWLPANYKITSRAGHPSSLLSTGLTVEIRHCHSTPGSAKKKEKKTSGQCLGLFLG